MTKIFLRTTNQWEKMIPLYNIIINGGLDKLKNIKVDDVVQSQACYNGFADSNPLRGSVAFLICSPSSSSTISIFFITSPSRSLDCSPPSLDCSPMLFSKQPWLCNSLLYARFFFSWNFYHRCFHMIDVCSPTGHLDQHLCILWSYDHIFFPSHQLVTATCKMIIQFQIYILSCFSIKYKFLSYSFS